MLVFKFLVLVLLSLTVIYLGVGVVLFVKQRSFIYFPSEAVQHEFAIATFMNQGHEIKSIVLNEGKGNAILYFGGNAESVAYTAKEFRNQFKSNTVYLVNYRGYGGSSGTPNEIALYSDALHIYDNLAHSHKNITVIGRSLGSGVASYLASMRPIKKLVLVTPFDSIQNVAQAAIPIYPMSFLLSDKYKSIDRVANIQADVLVLAAESDNVIPMSFTTNLVRAFSPTAIKFVVIEGAGHNDISSRALYYKTILNFNRTDES